MNTTMLLNRATTACGMAKLKLLTLAALVTVLSLAVIPEAHAQTLLNRRIRNTDFQIQPNPVTATCAVMNCTAMPVPIFPTLNAICPGAIDATCTFYIHLETNDHLSIRDTGRFQFLVDAAPPNPGPTDPPSFFTWNNNDPDSGVAEPFSHSYAVTARVVNSVANQVHPIAVNVTCTDANASGACTAITFLANLEVNIYTP